MSPSTKAKVVEIVRDQFEKKTCAVGDGGNDIQMLQAAHCGIAI